MKNSLTTFLFILLALNATSQVYSLYLTVNGTNKYIKDGTDSVYTHNGENYVFDRKVSVKRFTPHSMVTNAPATISNVDSNIFQTKYRSDTSRNNTYAALAGKQATLGFTPVPETRTVNGQALSGNITITTISGNAGSATALETSRTINGVSFNGTQNITTTDNINAYQAAGSPILAETLNFPLFTCNTSTALVDNTVRYVAVWLPKAATITGIRVYVRTQGNYTGDQNNRVGLYTYSGGTLTLVASSANSSTLWTSAANAFQTIAFSSTYNASAGLHFVGLLYNQSAQTTAPALAGGIALNNAAMATMLGTNSVKFLGTQGSSNDLPASQASTGITGTTASYWVALY